MFALRALPHDRGRIVEIQITRGQMTDAGPHGSGDIREGLGFGTQPRGDLRWPIVPDLWPMCEPLALDRGCHPAPMAGTVIRKGFSGNRRLMASIPGEDEREPAGP